MGGRISDRRVDKDPGWIERRFRELEAKISGKIGPSTPVAGGIITVQQIVTNPTALVRFINTDYVTATGSGNLVLTLTAKPTNGSLHIYIDGVYQPPTEWVYSVTDNTVTLFDPDAHLKSGDIMSAAYATNDVGDVEPDPVPLTALTARGASSTSSSAATSVALDADTVVGDFLVIAFAAHNTVSDAVPRTASIGTDTRLTQVSYNTWIGTARTLDPIPIVNPEAQRISITVASFAAPAGYKNSAYVAGAAGGTSTMAAPTVASTAAVLVVTSENRNGTADITSVPAGYTTDYDSATEVCNASIYHWVDGAETTTPSGTIGYSIHSGGHAYATVVGLQEFQ